MISTQEFDSLCTGHFAALTLEGGPTLQGYTRRDSTHGKFILFDGLATEDDGTVSKFSHRLERSQIQAASLLSEPPSVTDCNGTIHRMRAAFWEETE